jgi:hypothetical protein
VNKISNKLDKDLLNSLSYKKAGYASMEVVSGLQRHEPAARVVALAIVFAQVCKLYGVRPMEAMEVASRIADRSGSSDELRASKMYVEKEMKR